jgi:hypothetical protein
MRSRRVAALALFLGLTLGGPTRPGDEPETPIGPRWWPSEWGRTTSAAPPTA